MHRPALRDEILVLDEWVRGRVLSLGAFASKIEYSVGGVKYQVYVENSEFIHLHENEEDDY